MRLLAFLLVAGCAGAPVPTQSMLLGEIDRDTVLADAKWRAAYDAAMPDPQASAALLAVSPGASVLVLLGTWCGDSRREVARFWKALDAAGGAAPFTVRYVGVDRNRQDPDGLAEGWNLRYVPTFVVSRDGREVGRVVESAPHGIEVDIGALLRGEASGVMTGRTDL